MRKMAGEVWRKKPVKEVSASRGWCTCHYLLCSSSLSLHKHFSVFHLLPFVMGKKVEKITAKRGEFFINLTEAVVTFLHCLFTVIWLLIFFAISLLTHTKAYPQRGRKQRMRRRKRKYDAQVQTLNKRIIPIIKEFLLSFRSDWSY